MDGIGANEYIVTVTQGLVDFFSAGDTPAPWELNMWYHTLNAGYRPRLSGESDFPCIYDERVGVARTYVKSGKKLDYESYIDALKKGHSYVSEGNTHIINFKVDGLEAGTHNSELKLDKGKSLNITAQVAALLLRAVDIEWCASHPAASQAAVDGFCLLPIAAYAKSLRVHFCKTGCGCGSRLPEARAQKSPPRLLHRD